MFRAKTVRPELASDYPYIFQLVAPLYQRKLVHIIGTTYTGTESSLTNSVLRLEFAE
jgi:hypothetical protein